MSTRRAVVEKLLADVQDLLAQGGGHLVVVGDRETARHLPQMLADSIPDDLDPVIVPLAGSRDTVADCLAGAIREARSDRSERGEPAGSSQQRLALLLPDALSVPTSALRSLHEIASLLGSHRLILFVDRDSTPFLDPAEELISRMGVEIPQVVLEAPKLQLQAAPDPAPPVEATALEPAHPEPRAPEPEKREEPPEETETPPQEDLLPRFAEPLVIPAPRRVDLKALRRARRRAGAWRWTVLTAVLGTCLALPGLVGHGPVMLPSPAHDSVVAQAPTPNPTPVSVPVEPPKPEVAPAPEVAPPIEKPPAPPPAAVVLPKKKPAPPVPVTRRARTKPDPPRATAKRAPKKVTKPRPPPAAPRRVAKPERRVVTPPAIMVLVNFNAAPWANLEVDGRKVGPTPIGNVRLAAGKHRVRATFPDGRVVERSIRVDERRKRFQIR